MSDILTAESPAETIQHALDTLIAAQDRSFIDFLAAVDDFNDEAVGPLTDALGSDLHAQVLLLKLSNIAVGKYQYLRRHAELIARPFGIVADPCNSCPLACPGCLHAETARQTDIDWNPGNLKPHTFTRLIEDYGPYAITTRLFNWGEPLLNKQTPSFVAMARRYFNRTSISTNLSVPFDAEALVASGLDYLIMSVDGATQPTYERYRRKGNLDLVFENMRRLVEAKEKLGSKTPLLQWQYLLFNHTLPEMELALDIAKKIGLDEVNFTNAYDVGENDRSITLPENPPMAHHVLKPPGPGATQSSRTAAAGLTEKIRDHFALRWTDRLESEPAEHQGGTCQWLYKDMVMDANGRILPCCFVPKKSISSYFGHVDDADAFNSASYRGTRTFFPTGKSETVTACHSCPAVDSLPNVNNRQIPFYFAYIDLRSVVDRGAIADLANW